MQNYDLTCNPPSEMFNHGVNEVRHLLKANGSPEPEFNVNLVTAFSVIVREPKVEVNVTGGENLPEDTTQTTSNDGVEKLLSTPGMSSYKTVSRVLALASGKVESG